MCEQADQSTPGTSSPRLQIFGSNSSHDTEKYLNDTEQYLNDTEKYFNGPASQNYFIIVDHAGSVSDIVKDMISEHEDEEDEDDTLALPRW